MAMRSSAYAALFFSLVTFLSALIDPATAAEFTCKGTQATCKGLVDYVTPNTTTLARISYLFSVTNLYDLLGANSLPLSTKSNYIVKAGDAVKIPFPCICSNNTGISNRVPVYTVYPGDGLDHIARDVYAALVTYQEIAKVNNITNANLIEIGQNLTIPLPCSCDEVGGAKVVHYGHKVAEGNSVAEIAAEYGTDQATLLSLNKMSNASELQTGQVLDVPLKVCSSSVNISSEDYPMLVPNGTYALTAYNCVQCSCHSSNNYKLQCQSSGLAPTSNVTKCPSLTCEGGSVIGTNISTCTSCAYAGFINKNILTTLDNSTCSSSSAPAPSGNSAPARTGSQGSSWRVLLVTIHLGLLCFGFLC